MDAVLVKLYQPRFFAFDMFQIPFTVELSAIVKHIVLPGHIENISLVRQLLILVESFDSSGFDNCVQYLPCRSEKTAGSRHRVNAIESDLKFIGRRPCLAALRTDMAVADLRKKLRSDSL